MSGPARVALLLLAGLAASCTGGEGTSTTTTTTTAQGEVPSSTAEPEVGADEEALEFSTDDYARALVEAGDGFEEVMTDDESLCFMAAFVDGIGLERIVATGATPEDLAEGDVLEDLVGDDESRELLIDGFVECVDVHALVVMGAGLDDEQASCLKENVEERWLAEALVGETDDGDPSTPDPTFSQETVDATEQAFEACPEAMAALG